MKAEEDDRTGATFPWVQVYVDGSCRGNPGIGGYGVVITRRGFRRELSGGAENTTNNRMELRAVIAALQALSQSCAVTIQTDSQYVATSWPKAAQWRREGRLCPERSPNADLWHELLDASAHHHVNIQWVRGHRGNEGNQRADQLARAAARQQAQRVTRQSAA